MHSKPPPSGRHPDAGIARLMPVMTVAATSGGMLFMCAIIGAIPFTDAMIVRYVDDTMRSRVSRMGLAVSLGASDLVVWLIGPIVKAAGLSTLLWVMLATSCITFVVVSLLPGAAGRASQA